MRAIKAREEGISSRKVAKELGVCQTTILRWTNPKYQEATDAYKREWNRNNPHKHRQYEETHLKKNRCSSCKKPGRYKDGVVCADCKAEDRRFRRVEIQRLWNEEGMTAIEIGEALGVSRFYIEREIVLMRKAGWKIHYRLRPPPGVDKVRPGMKQGRDSG